VERDNVSFDCLGQNLLRLFPVNRMNGALDGKRLVAIRRPSDKKSRMVSALSSIWSFMYSGVVGIGGMVPLLGILSVARRLVRSVCTREAVCSIVSFTSSAH
jgi:hypothetical protein